ncbi:hypothetical protein L9H26_18895 [Morganella psychrotolerans]|uniref:Uncharacterized protein n=1 Tax=Morganella psychrotolerans TaxID=368603 RepID=A0A5M9QXR5_9GAMM|nr:hypothetical protein [Morganella psychrotolerans]KAA8712971.1 hypothetical protein F4V73_17795 [Morganella psychrotolerans]
MNKMIVGMSVALLSFCTIAEEIKCEPHKSGILKFASGTDIVEKMSFHQYLDSNIYKVSGNKDPSENYDENKAIFCQAADVKEKKECGDLISNCISWYGNLSKNEKDELIFRHIASYLDALSKS